MLNDDNMNEAVPLKPLASPQVRATAGDVEIINLELVPGLGNEQYGGGGGGVSASCCNDQHHRKLAVCSIVCGCSCIGYRAVINSVKAETAADPEAAAEFSRRARKLGLISIVTWIAVLVLLPLLVVFMSYILTFID